MNPKLISYTMRFPNGSVNAIIMRFDQRLRAKICNHDNYVRYF
jgi:hypothetical protein